MKYQKSSTPELLGGNPAPSGYLWKALSFKQHDHSVMRALSTYRGQTPTEILTAIHSFYQAHYKEEIDKAFEKHRAETSFSKVTQNEP